MPNYGIFDFIWGYIPLTAIHVSGPAILILYQWQIKSIALVLANFTCQKSLQTVHYSSMGEMYRNIK